MIRLTARFTGNVQGVGFRATTVSLSRDFVVAGTVKNMDDGSVRLVVEGKEDQVTGLLHAIETRMANHINDTDTDTAAATDQFGKPQLGGVRVAY